MERIICIIIGYVFGMFQTAFIYGKLHGIDIREHGSGNAGTTNTLRVLGTKAGMIVLAGDIIKCILAIVICGALFDKSHPEELFGKRRSDSGIYAETVCGSRRNFRSQFSFLS